jgi:hypothetical protein
MKSLKNLVFVPALVLAICTAAQAGVISQTQSFSGTPNFSQGLSFDQFDTLGGTRTLSSIEVILDLNVDGGQLILDNDGIDPAAGLFEFGGKATLSSTDVALGGVPGTAAALHSDTFNLAGNIGDGPTDYDPSAPDGMIYLGGPESDSKSGFVNSLFWTAGTKGFIGTGTYIVDLDATQWSQYGSIGGIEYAVTPVVAGGSVKVIYTYVPEPASLSLLGLGAAALLKRGR